MIAFGQHLELRSGKAVYTDWGPRGDDNARFYVEVLDGDSDSRELNVAVYHKDREVTGDGSSAGSQAITVSAGKGYVEVTGLYELVRLRFSITSPSAGNWLRFRVLGVVWFDTGTFSPPAPVSP